MLPAAAIRRVNEALDPLFLAGSDSQRAYVGADRLVALHVTDELLSPPVQALICAVTPDAVVYHCHAYEIEGGQERPHIRAGHLAGWHRDEETIPGFDPYTPRHVSLFVYLTDVGQGGGAFELAPQLPGAALAGGRPAVSVTGPAGTAFAWNRSYYHRASPNTAPTRRRVLKLSWQPVGVHNDRIDLPEMVEAGRRLGGGDEFTRAFFSAQRPGGGRLPAPACDPPTPQTLVPSGRVGISRSDEALGRVWALGQRTRALARGRA